MHQSSLRASRKVALSAAMALVLAVSSCSGARTQIVLWLLSDTQDCQLRNIHVRCGLNWIDPRHTDPPAMSCDDVLTRGTSSSAEIQLPASLGVTYPGSDLSSVLTLVIDDNTMTPLVPEFRRVVQVHYVANQTARLSVVINSACLAVAPMSATHPCPPGQTQCTQSQSCETMSTPDTEITCGNDGTCRAAVVTSDELVLGLDAGVPDSGLAPVPDASCR